MDAPTFFKLARRLPNYPGSMQAIALEHQESGGGKKPKKQHKVNSAVEQRFKLRDSGGEATAVKTDNVSYIHEKLRQHREK